MSFPRYPDYRDSGVEWLGEVPGHWQLAKLKHLARFAGGGTPSRDNPNFWGGSIPWVSPKDMKVARIETAEECITEEGLAGSSTGLIPPGRVLMVVRSGILKHTIPVAINAAEVALNQDMKALDFSAGACSAEFFFRWVQGLNDFLLLEWAKQGATVESIEHAYLAETLLPLPPAPEQAAIAAFLDRETAKIDALVAEQQNLIALLKEKHQALISHAVTKGLDPDVRMKDSGVAWLGEVPAHWEIWKIAHAFGCIGSGTTPPSNEPKWYDEGEIPWVTTGELRENLVTSTAKCVTREAVETFSSLRVHPTGSLVIAMYGATIGRLGVLGVDATTNQACCVLSSPKNLDVPFVFHWLSAFKDHLIDLYASGGGQPNINQEIVASLRIPAPSTEEQVRIVAALDQEVTQLQSLVDEAESTIALLQERRTALISAAVTGKIDVRHLGVASTVPTPEPA